MIWCLERGNHVCLVCHCALPGSNAAFVRDSPRDDGAKCLDGRVSCRVTFGRNYYVDRFPEFYYLSRLTRVRPSHHHVYLTRSILLPLFSTFLALPCSLMTDAWMASFDLDPDWPMWRPWNWWRLGAAWRINPCRWRRKPSVCWPSWLWKCGDLTSRVF